MTQTNLVAVVWRNAPEASAAPLSGHADLSRHLHKRLDLPPSAPHHQGRAPGLRSTERATISKIPSWCAAQRLPAITTRNAPDAPTKPFFGLPILLVPA